jgi:hypothetical protein
MSDKDRWVVISEMLRKQDQQAEKLDEHSVILNEHTELLRRQSATSAFSISWMKYPTNYNKLL